METMTNNYFRTGFGHNARYFFFDDTNEVSIKKAWAALPRQGIDAAKAPAMFRAPLIQGPWRAGAVIIFDRFGLDEGIGKKGTGESVLPVTEEGEEKSHVNGAAKANGSPKGGPGGRSKLGPVLS